MQNHPENMTAEASGNFEQRIQGNPGRFRVLTGDRPTGRLHLGHYFGTLQNRVRLQDLGVESFVPVADYQVLTDRDAAENLASSVEGLILDYLAVGIGPDRTTIFTHSAIAALNQLPLPFLSLVSVAELGRNPTVKDEIAHSRQSAVSGLMFTYPVRQAADILFCKANLVPVGQDQLPHLEVTRTIARRFNSRYAPEAGIFPEPEALLSAAPSLLGTDGGKMSKSRGNAVALADDADETARLIRGAKTDSIRHVSYEPGDAPRGLQPCPAGVPLHRSRFPRGRGGDWRRRCWCAEEDDDGGSQRAPGADPGAADRLCTGARLHPQQPQGRQ